MHRSKPFLLALALVLPPAAAHAADLSAGEMLARADAYRNFRGQSFTFNLTLRSIRPGEADRTFGLAVAVRDAHTSLVRYVAPTSERGKALLMAQNNLWFQAPTNRKPIRITPQQRLLGEVSNGDVASTDFSGDYEPALGGEETVDGAPAYKLSLTAREGSLATYHSLDLWVRKDDFRPLRATFYAPSGKALKTAVYRRYEKLEKAGGKPQLVELEIADALQPSQRTLMQYANFAVTELPASDFNPASLSRLP